MTKSLRSSSLRFLTTLQSAYGYGYSMQIILFYFLEILEDSASLRTNHIFRGYLQRNYKADLIRTFT